MARIALALFVVLPLTGCFSAAGGSRGWSAALEQALLFHPRPYPEGDWTPDSELFEEVSLRTLDGAWLHGWFAEAREPRCVVLYCHGNAGNITSRRWVLQLFRDRLNCSILVFDYRGYGRSTGAPSEEGFVLDARTARGWLARKAGVPEAEIVLVGNSLGGGVAVDLAARDGARGLVLENTFPSVAEAAAHHFWPLPVDRLVHNRFDSLAKIRDYHGPLLQTHGDADTVIPFELGHKLFDAANEPKQLVPVRGGGHNDPPARDYLRALDQFLETLPGTPLAAPRP